MARKNFKKAMDIDEISYESDIEENGFEEEIIGTPVASFSSEHLEENFNANLNINSNETYERITKASPNVTSDEIYENNRFIPSIAPTSNDEKNN